MSELALIIGVGPGLSSSLAKLCASNKMKVILAARDINKLDSLKKEIETLVSLRVNKIINKIEIPNISGFPPLDAPPGKNLLILSCKVLIISSMFGGVGPLLPEPFPPPPGGDPQGLPPLPLKSSTMTIYIMSLLRKTS